MKNKIHILVLFLGSLTWGCKKELNVFPTTSEVDGNVIVDTKSAAALLNGVYYRFADIGVDHFGVQTVLWTDINETIPSEMCNLIIVPGGSNEFTKLSFTSNTSGEDLIWNYGYQLVNAANGFLKNIAPVTVIPIQAKKQMQAEARFLRAFGNAELLLYYGQCYDVNSKYGIILRNEFVTPDNINLPRSTVAQSYNAIVSDLDSAIKDLPVQNTQAYFTNISAAKLLKARVLINRGSSGDYAEVISLTSDIIKNSPFALEDNVKDVFLTKGFISKEVILGVQPYTNQSYKFRLNQLYANYVASNTLVDFFNNDPRNQWVYKDDQAGSIYGAFYGSLNENTKYYTGPVVSPVKTQLSETSYAFRLTEAYLLEAEAITLSGGDLSQAKTLLKNVESHAGITDFSDIINTTDALALQVLIIREEMKNFVAENGADWFAFRRLPFSVAQSIQPALKNKNQLILPIPNSEIITNGKLVQNP